MKTEPQQLVPDGGSHTHQLLTHPGGGGGGDWVTTTGP